MRFHLGSVLGLNCIGRASNLCLQQTKPPVTAPACAGAAPDVFAAEAQVLGWKVAHRE